MDEDQLVFRPPDPAMPTRSTGTEIIMKRLARMPTRDDLWRAVLIGMFGGACLTQLLLAPLFR
jgi:hypothetical protein